MDAGSERGSILSGSVGVEDAEGKTISPSSSLSMAVLADDGVGASTGSWSTSSSVNTIGLDCPSVLSLWVDPFALFLTYSLGACNINSLLTSSPGIPSSL